MVRFLTYKQFDIYNMTYVKQFICQKSYQIVYNVFDIFQSQYIYSYTLKYLLKPCTLNISFVFKYCYKVK